MSYRYSRRKLIKQASLTQDDFEQVKRRRRPENKLGFAYQIGFVRLHNRLPAQQPLEVINELLAYTAIQIDIEADLIHYYSKYQPNVSAHQAQIREYLNLTSFTKDAAERLQDYIFEQACRLEHNVALVNRAEQFLRSESVLQPADYKLSRIVGEQRKIAREQIFSRITSSLSNELKQILDQLLVVEADESTSLLQQIKANPKKPSAEAVLMLTKKLSAIKDTSATNVDLTWLNNNYQRVLFHYVRNCSVDRLRQLSGSRRYASLICFLWQSYRDAIDQTVDMFDKLLLRMENNFKNAQLEALQSQRKTIKTSLVSFQYLSDLILDDSIPSRQLRNRIFESISPDDLKLQSDAVSDWTSGKHSDLLSGIIERYSYLRRFSPALVNSLSFIADNPDHPCLEALTLLKNLNDSNKRSLPDDAPIKFAPKKARPYIIDDNGKLKRRAWETVLLLKVKDEIRAGNLAVESSKRFGEFDNFFINTKQWVTVKQSFYQRAGLPDNPEQVNDYLTSRLNKAYELYQHRIINSEQHDSQAESILTDQQAAAVDQLKSWLKTHMRRIRLPELLIEVDNELNFTRHFMTPAQNQNQTPNNILIVLATILSRGCNIGPHTMAQLTPGATYKQIKKVNDWQMIDDTQRAALALLVNAISNLDTSLYWGEGKTSASDGQRFGLPSKVLQQTYSPRFSDFALEFYTFIADNYAPFYSTPIECTDRDSAFVLDGLLYNESELDLAEHYTDTHGYTEINFAAFAMLGRRFCPRIRSVQKQRIYCIDRSLDYGELNEMLKRSDRRINPKYIAEQWDRMGHFYASLEAGHTAASVALKRLVGFSSKNRFYRANRDLGRIFKTEFILQYMTEPHLRHRIQKGLLKIEQLHALARDVFYAKRGRISAQELQDQMNSCSCLTLILACIIYWQAKEISKVISQHYDEESGIDLSMLAHVSPIEWENVILYGQYVIDKSLIKIQRP